MKWSFKIGSPFGIPVRIHLTFLILLAFVLFPGDDGRFKVMHLLLTISVFAGVVLHELGHSLAARQFGIQVRDITLWPLGGLARMERFPKEPIKQIIIAVAGPGVSFALAGIFGVMTFLMVPDLKPATQLDQFVLYLAEINLMLGMFNLIPALPMDGGRVLRGVLAMTSLKDSSTKISARVGQVFAVLMAGFGIAFDRTWLVFIAIFIFMMAEQEWRMESVVNRFRSTPVWKAMLRPVTTAGRMTSVQSLANYAQDHEQQDFPVIEGRDLVGMVTRWDISQAMSTGRLDDPAFTIMDRNVPIISPEDSLENILKIRIPFARLVLPVMHGAQVVGLVTPERIRQVRSA